VGSDSRPIGVRRAESYQPPAPSTAHNAKPRGAAARRAEPRSPGRRRAAWVLGTL